MKFGTRVLVPVAVSLITSGSALAQSSDAPYGTAKFAPYADIDSVKQLKVVWDFNFVDPKAVGLVFNYVNALLRATAEFGPREIDPIKVVIVSHGPEVVVFDKKNYGKYKEIVDRAASLASQGVKFEICGLAAAAQGSTPEDLHGFVTVVPAAPYALAYWQSKGYTLNAVGATMPTSAISDLNRADIRKK
jgi:intracellular sulfur oxidation DsrE/DsrF family protein